MFFSPFPLSPAVLTAAPPRRAGGRRRSSPPSLASACVVLLLLLLPVPVVTVWLLPAGATARAQGLRVDGDGGGDDALFGARQNPPVAQILRARPLVQRHRQAKRISVRSLDTLRPGDVLHLPADQGGEAVIVCYDSGKRWRLPAGSKTRIEAGGALRTLQGRAPQSLRAVRSDTFRPIRAAYQSGKIIGNLYGGQIVRSVGPPPFGSKTMGSDTPPPLQLTLSPAFLDPDRVVVRLSVWQAREKRSDSGAPLASIRSVLVTFTYLGGGETGGEPPTRASVTWSLPEPTASRPATRVRTVGGFVRGGRYRITVATLRDGGRTDWGGRTVAQQTFRVLTTGERQTIARQLSEIAAEGGAVRESPDDCSPELMAALLLESFDLREEAYARYGDALQVRPAESAARDWRRTYAPFAAAEER